MADTKATALTALATLASGDLFYVVDDPGGTPVSKKITIDNVAAFLRALTETMTNKTLTNPVIAQINDANGNEAIQLSATASAVNFLKLVNSATGNDVSIEADGGDTNIGFAITVKGSGTAKVGSDVIATLTATQTLTNKTLTSPTLNSPTLVTPALGTPSSGNGSNLTALNASQLTSGTVPAARIGADTIDALTEIAAALKAGSGSKLVTNGNDASVPVYTEKHSTSHTIDAAECYGGIHYVTGAATITLPAVAAGMQVTIVTVGAVAVSVDPNASDLILLDGTALDDGDKLTNSSTSGDTVTLAYYDATGWYAITDGNWTDGGA